MFLLLLRKWSRTLKVPRQPMRFALNNRGNHKQYQSFVGYNCTVQISIEVSKLHTSQVHCKQHVQYTSRAERPLRGSCC